MSIPDERRAEYLVEVAKALAKAAGARIRKGDGLRGPDVMGCYNTGFEPILHHDRRGFWYAGFWNDIVEVMQKKLFMVVRGNVVMRGVRRKIHVHKRLVLRGKTKAPAARYFAELVGTRILENRIEAEGLRQEVTKLRDAKDPSTAMRAAFKLSDAGMLL